MDDDLEPADPAWKAFVYGAAYVAGGYALIVVARHSVTVLRWLLTIAGVVLIVAGLWTGLVVGGLLALVGFAEAVDWLSRRRNKGD